MRKVSVRGKKPARVTVRPVLVVPPDYPSGAVQLVALVKSQSLLEPVDLAARCILGTY